MTTPLRLYNTAVHRVIPVVPSGDTVTVYVCGITPYDTTHLGHLFTYVAADILIRYLEYKGLNVTYVQNLTDIDDPMLRQARKQQEDWQALGNHWTAQFMQDMQVLNVRPPDHYPRATEMIEAMIATIARLVNLGVAYVVSGNVYFHVPAWPDYGKLSDLSRQAMLALAADSGDDPNDPCKRDPLDFILWKASSPDEPSWVSPWSPGRPGWHIECSTMASHFLGETIDIHGGGTDLLFPHHESEVAQAECASGQGPFVRHWFHTAMVQYEGEKMSKSLGNLVMGRDLLEAYSPDGVRLYLAQHHYRQPWAHHEQTLERADKTAQRLRAATMVVSTSATAAGLETDTWHTAFHTAMDNDLQTPQAIEVVSQLAHAILQAHEAGRQVTQAQQCLRTCAHILGLRLDAERPEARVQHGWGSRLAQLA
jgi:L-cysteine:1D-myo-inositol 2-amino-2-deoxy-alpha-D-glucopyranoside ligase